MISDVLFDASVEIRRYLDDPFYRDGMYKNVLPRVYEILGHMDKLRNELDTPPQDDPTVCSICRQPIIDGKWHDHPCE